MIWRSPGSWMTGRCPRSPSWNAARSGTVRRRSSTIWSGLSQAMLRGRYARGENLVLALLARGLVSPLQGGHDRAGRDLGAIVQDGVLRGIVARPHEVGVAEACAGLRDEVPVDRRRRHGGQPRLQRLEHALGVGHGKLDQVIVPPEQRTIE